MSLIGSLLGLVLIPLKATRRELAAERPKEVENLALLAMADELRRTTFALNYWRETGLALIEENERVKRQRDSLAAQIRELAQQKDPTSPCYRHGGFAQAQQAYNQGHAYAHYTCVPARSEVLRRDPPE